MCVCVCGKKHGITLTFIKFILHTIFSNAYIILHRIDVVYSKWGYATVKTHLLVNLKYSDKTEKKMCE